MKHTSILSFILLTCSLQAQSITWKIFEGENYAIQFPNGWNIKEVTNEFKNAGVEFIAVSEKESSTDTFLENVNLLVETLNETTTDLATYMVKAKEAIKKNVPELNQLNIKYASTQSGPCYIFQYHGKQQKNSLFWYQVVWVKDTKAYTLTLTSDKKSHWSFKRAFEVIGETFVIK